MPVIMEKEKNISIRLDLAIVVVALIIASSTISFLIGSNSSNKEQEQTRQANIEKCLDDALDTYNQRWTDSCKDKGEEADCSLSSTTSSQYDIALQKDKEICLQRYNK